jgi:hypothetical protein
MKKEYLDDYQAREGKEFARFTRKILSHGLDLDDRYPSLQRLGIIHQPIVLAARNTYLFDKEKIWSQIPFAGTLLIPLSAYDKDHTLNGCGFDVNDIQTSSSLQKRQDVYGLDLLILQNILKTWVILNQYLENSSRQNYFTCPMRLYQLIQKHTIIFARNLRLQRV